MTRDRYRVVLSGELSEQQAYESAVHSLATMFHTSPQRARKIFGGKVQPLNRALDRVKAEKLKEKIESAGARCNIEPASVGTGMEVGNRHTPFRENAPPGLDATAGKDELNQETSQQRWMLSTLLTVLTLGLFLSFHLTHTQSATPEAIGSSVESIPEGGQVTQRRDRIGTTWPKLVELDQWVMNWLEQQGDNADQVTLNQVREAFGLSSVQMLDSWGGAILYETTLTGFNLRSVGLDKQPNTKDDLVLRQVLVPQTLNNYQHTTD